MEGHAGAAVCHRAGAAARGHGLGSLSGTRRPALLTHSGAATALMARATHRAVPKKCHVRPAAIHPDHAIAAAASTPLITATAGGGCLPTATTTSAMTMPNNTPATTAITPLSSYSPRMSAERAATAAPTMTARACRIGRQG